MKIYCPVGIERRRGEGDVLTWNGNELRWNGEPLRWGGGDQLVVTDDLQPSSPRSMIARRTRSFSPARPIRSRKAALGRAVSLARL